MNYSGQSNILIVDDTPANLRLLTQMLAEQNYYVRPVTSGSAALAAAFAAPPDLILLDIRMSGMDGYEVCQRLKADERTRFIPIIFLSALGETEDKLKAFHAGGVDYITKPFHAEEVLARVRTHLALERVRAQLEAANRDLRASLAREEHLARTDWLTGMLNRSHFFAMANQEFLESGREQRPLVVLLFDVDHFKQINDHFGHPIGDVVLKQMAQLAARQFRGADLLGRYGGEEFIALLPATNTQQALVVGERLLNAIRSLKVETEKGLVNITISLGIAERLPDDKSLEVLIDRADQAMYAAKRAGRDCLVSA
jgi:diguanylate cyclase (GGDEF)-like protein